MVERGSQWAFTVERFEWLRGELSRRVPMLERLGAAFSILLERFLDNPPRAETVAIHDLEERMLASDDQCEISDLLTVLRVERSGFEADSRHHLPAPYVRQREVAPPPILEDRREWNRYLQAAGNDKWESRFPPVLIPMLLTVRAGELLGGISSIDPHLYEEAQALTESLLREVLADVVRLSNADDVLAVSQMLYWPHNEFVFVFSRSPGILLPEERHRGILRSESHDFVDSYFQNMVETQCEVIYHFSPQLVHQELRSHWPLKKAALAPSYRSKRTYQNIARILVSSFLDARNFHLFAMDEDDLTRVLAHVPIIGSGGVYVRQYEDQGDWGLLMGPEYVPLVIGWIARCLGNASPQRAIDDARAAVEGNPRDLQTVIEAVLSGRRYRVWPPEPGHAARAVSQDPAWAASRLVDLLDVEWSGLSPGDFAIRLWEWPSDD